MRNKHIKKAPITIVILLITIISIIAVPLVVQPLTANNIYTEVGGARTATTATNVSIDPAGVVYASSALYVVDRIHSEIREFSGTGYANQSVVAGIGSPGYLGDGGLATSAELKEPDGMTIDSTGI